MHTGIMDVRASLVHSLHPSSPYVNTGIELSTGKELSFTGASSTLQPDIPSFASTELSDGAHGTVCMEARHRKEG